MNTKQLFCTFYIDRFLYGVEVNCVQEVLRELRMTRVPLAPSEIGGLMNLRGNIIPVIDMRNRLCLNAAQSTNAGMNVVLRGSEGPTSLQVDSIGEVVAVDDQSWEPLPPTLSAEQRALVRGVYKLDRQLLLMLDTEAVIAGDTARS